MMQIYASIKNKYALHRFIKLRQRHILTKNNKLRLRYIAGYCITFLALIILALGNISNNSFINYSIGHLEQFAQAILIVEKNSSDTIKDDSLARNALKNHVSGGIRKASVAIKKSPKSFHKNMKIGNGDTISEVLQKAGLSSSEAYYTVKALSKYYDPKKIKPGQRLKVNFKSGKEGALIFSKMSMKINSVKTVIITKVAEKFISTLEEKKLKERSYARTAEIETSLYGSAAKAGIPPQIIAEIIRVYSWDVDFQRDIRNGDKIEVLYETEETEDGNFTHFGDVLYANLSVSGKEIPIYRYKMKNGRIDYFEPNGFSIKKTLMKTPIDGARISSGFGMRIHPILGYAKEHKGIDFAAPTGTPIYAAGDGVINFKGRKSGYGNYIRIRHNSKLQTAYAHMHKYAKNMCNGKRVKQGQIIGYVGTTGRSTGPHLHYEVIKNGIQVNPKSVDLPIGEQLLGTELAQFKSLIRTLNQQYATLSENLKFAQRETISRFIKN